MGISVHVTRTSFDRMVAKSEEQTRHGNLPRLLRVLAGERTVGLTQIWSVASRTVSGEIRIVEVTWPPDGGKRTLTCDCPATGHCWHRVHVLRALDSEAPYYRTPERTPEATQRLAGAASATF